MIKFTCIDEQHAHIAAKQLKGRGRNCAVIKRTVVASGDHDNYTAKVQAEAMAYTESPNEYDQSELESASK